VGSNDIKTAPCCIYEFPLDDVPPGGYLMGVDAYNTNESSDRINSLGSIYVFKRTVDVLGKFQYAIVASYAGRPSEITEFYQIGLNLAEFYNATVLPEWNPMFVDYFINKNKGYYIHNSIQLAREINPQTQVKTGDKGLTATTRNQKYYMDLMVHYTKESITMKHNEFGEVAAIGVERINDPMLLQEMISYKGKKSSSTGVHDGNFDRIVAFGHCLVLAEHLDKLMPISSNKSFSKESEKPKHQEIQSPWFTMNKTPTSSTRKSSSPFLSMRK
jgi:hypothetical protein